MKVIRAADREAVTGGEHFTKATWLEESTTDDDERGLRVAVVHFSPGARARWHRHEGGQVLYILYGHGVVRVRTDSGTQRAEVGPGDCVIAGPDEYHSHGSSATSFMCHLSVTNEATTWPVNPPGDEG